MTLDKKITRLCKNTINSNGCNDSCMLYEKCIVKNDKVKSESLVSYIKELNSFSNQIINC